MLFVSLLNLVIWFLMGSLFGAVCFRAAVALYNKMVGGTMASRSVPEPAFGKAAWIIFISNLVYLPVSFLVVPNVTNAGMPVSIVVQLISFPVSLLAMAAMLPAMLPTTFGRASLVTLCYMLFVILVFGVVWPLTWALIGIMEFNFTPWRGP